MINDKALEDRLNAVKNGNPLPSPPDKNPNIINKESTSTKSIPKNNVLDIILNTSNTLFTSFLYGYAINTIFSLEWSLLGSLAVGYLLKHIINMFPDKLFTK